MILLFVSASVPLASSWSIPLAQGSPHMQVPLELAPAQPTVPSCLNVNYPPRQYWQLHTPMPTPRHHFATISQPDQSAFYAIGGMLGWSDAVTASERFNACANTWESMTPLPVPRGYVQAAELNGHIYIVGGVDHVISNTYGVQASVWVYDSAIDAWQEAHDLPQALGGAAVAAVNGKVYAFGGFDSRGPGVGDVNAVYEYDPNNDQWTVQPAMPAGARSLASAAALNGELYVVGGVANDPYLNGLTRNEVYNPSTQLWRTASPIEWAQHSLTLVASPDGYLYAGGGAAGVLSEAWPLRYDPAANQWSSVADAWTMNDLSYHAASGVALAAGRLYIVGGFGRPRYDDETHSNVVESAWLFDTVCQSSLSAQPDLVVPTGFITYTAELRADTSDLNNVNWYIDIPEGTIFNSFISKPGGMTYDAGGQIVKWHGSLPAYHTPLTATFKVYVPNSGWAGRQSITNTMSVFNGSTMLIQRKASTQIDAFDLAASTKRANRATAVIGDVLTYTLHVQNTSPQGGSVTVNDPIPLNTAYLPGSLYSTAGTAHYGNGRVVWSDQLNSETQVYHNATDKYQWGDSLGHGPVPGVKYDWIEIAATGTHVQHLDPHNSACYDKMFPFDFQFGSGVYTKTSVTTNGVMYFEKPDAPISLVGPDNWPLLGGRELIALMWDDLNLAPGHIFYQILGAAPNRRVVIEFNNVTRHASPTAPGLPATFEMIFFEGSNNILLQYKSTEFGDPAIDHGASATAGVQITWTEALQYSYNTPSLSDGLAILYVPPDSSYTYIGNEVEIGFAVQVNAVLPDRTPITNTATIASSSGQTIERQTVALYGAPDFSTSYKSARQSIVQAGDGIDYEIHLINTGPVDGQIQLTDVVPNGPFYFESDGFEYPFGIGNYDDTTGVLEWTGTVPTMSSATIHFRVEVNFDPQTQPPIMNTAVFTDVVTGVVYRRSVTLDDPKLADLFVTASGPGAIDSTAPFTYTITYGNAGPFDTEVIPMVRVDLPANVAFVSASPDSSYFPPSAVAWYPDVLAAGTSRTVTITVAPTDVPSGTVLVNSVSISNITQDMDATNNSAQWFTRAGSVPDLLNGTQKSAEPIYVQQAGDVITYTITIANTGLVTASTTITDPLPSEVGYLAGSSTIDGTPIELYDAATNQIRWTGPIERDGDVIIRYSAVLTTTASVTNTVTIDDGTGLMFDRSAVTLSRWFVFLPVVMR
jgi:uncharacterized repeat protein (TIGR01451 family)